MMLGVGLGVGGLGGWLKIEGVETGRVTGWKVTDLYVGSVVETSSNNI